MPVKISNDVSKIFHNKLKFTLNLSNTFNLKKLTFKILLIKLWFKVVLSLANIEH